MKFSKKAFISAAFILGGAVALSAAETIKIDGTTQKNVSTGIENNYHVTQDGVLELVLADKNGTYTMYGQFLGGAKNEDLKYDYTNKEISARPTREQQQIGDDGQPVVDDDGNPVMEEITLPPKGWQDDYKQYNGDTGKIVIKGGGTLQYNGFSDIKYYSGTLTVNNGQGRLDGTPSSLLGKEDNLGWVDPSSTAFSGHLAIEGGTTLIVGGYLSQQISLWQPRPVADSENPPSGNPIINVGISDITLSDTSTISFKTAEKNLLNKDFQLGDQDHSAPAGAEAVRALNFLNNVKGSVNSTIEIGTDVASTSRIIITSQYKYFDYKIERDEEGRPIYDIAGNPQVEGKVGEDLSTTEYSLATYDTGFNLATQKDWDGKSSVGILKGTGRVYFAGLGEMSILNAAQFSTRKENTGNGSIDSSAFGRDWVGYTNALSANYDLHGEVKDEAGNYTTSSLADVYFVGGYNYLNYNGKPAEVGGATKLGTSDGKNIIDNVLATATAVQLESRGDSPSPRNQIAGAAWEERPRYAGFNSNGNRGFASDLQIYGTQVLNNLQSLFIERASIVAESNEGEGFYEITPMVSKDAYATYLADDATVSVKSGSTLIINQLEDRDGVYAGRLITSDNIYGDPDVNGGEPEMNDGYIVKTGAGSFVHINPSSSNEYAKINRLYIEEGKWFGTAQSLGTEDSRIIVGKNGELRLLESGESGILRVKIEGTSSFVIARDTSFMTEIDGEMVRVGGIQNDGRWLIATSKSIFVTRNHDNAEVHENQIRGGIITIWREQQDFRGAVVVEEDMTLSLGYNPYSNSGQETIPDGGAPKYNPWIESVKQYELGSVFSNASGISLVGGKKKSLLTINSYQIVSNLSNDGDNARVEFNGYARLVLNQQNTSAFSGTITGNGDVIKTGSQLLELASGKDAYANYTGSTVALVGSISLAKPDTIAASSGVVLNGNSAIMSSGRGDSQQFGALIGSKDTSVLMSGGLLTVGISDAARAEVVKSIHDEYESHEDVENFNIDNTYYFATYAGDSKYFGENGLNLGANAGITDSVKNALGLSKLGSVRPQTDANGTQMTVNDTTEYLKDPGKLKNAFAHLYATMDSKTFAEISATENWKTCFGNEAKDVNAWLRKIFDQKTVNEFVDGKPAGWSERKCEELKTFAEKFYRGEVKLLDDEGNLTYGAYKYLTDCYAIDFLFEKYIKGKDLKNSNGETIGDASTRLDYYYGFFTLFYDQIENKDYELVLTDANVAEINKKFGFTISYNKDDKVRWESFENAIGLDFSGAGVYGPEFAGTISGDGASLRKIGTESLTLTGVNTYTGATSIEGGELRIDWDAIKYSAEVKLSAGALLTIVSKEGESNIFKLGVKDGVTASGYGKIYGSGTILKDGAGTLVIENALANKDENRVFNGAIIVGRDELRVNVKDLEDADFDIYLNKYDGKEATFVLDFQNIATGEGEDPKGTELSFKGEVKGSGTFVKAGLGKLVFENGDEFADTKNSSFGLRVDGGEVAIKLVANKDGAGFRDEHFKSELGKDATFTFDVAQDAGGSADGWIFAGRLVRESGATGTTFRKTGAGTLTLSRSGSYASESWDIDNVKLDAGTLVVSGTAYGKFKDIDSAEGTKLSVSGSGSIAISNSGDDVSTLAGALDGSGTIVKAGTGSLVISGENAFAGKLKLNGGTLELDSAANRTVSFSIEKDADDASSRTASKFVKSGSGAIKMTGSITKELAIDVQGGKLSVSGADSKFTGAKSLSIANGAVFEIAPTATNSAGAMILDKAIGSISGDGKLALGSGTTKLEASISDKFLGTIELTNKDSVLELGSKVSTFSGIAGAGTLKIAVDEFNFVQKHSETFTGTISGTGNTKLIISGEGSLNLADSSGANQATLDGMKVQLGSNGKTGAIGVAINQGQDIYVSGNGNSVALVGEVKADSGNYNGKVILGADVGEINLRATGNIDLATKDVAKLFNVGTAPAVRNVATEVGVLANPNLTITLANFGANPNASGRDLTVSLADGENALNKNVRLGTSLGGALKVSVAGADKTAKYDYSIGGDGNFEKVGSGTLVLSGGKHTYTGATKVSAGTLDLGDNSELASSKLTVAKDATLVGGAELTAAASNVVFEKGSTWRVNVKNGGHITFNGTASGEFKLDIEEVDTSKRGVGIKLVEYTGTAEVNDRTNTLVIAEQISANDKFVFIDKNSQKTTGDLVIYAAQKHLTDIAGVDWHDGIGSFLDLMSEWARPDENGNLIEGEKGTIGEAINKTATGNLAEALNNLSPMSYAAMVSMPRSSFLADSRAVSGRLEQRLYDNASPYAVWEYQADWEFFAQSQGSTVNSGDDSDSMTYDYNTYGALAGMDRKLNHSTSFGLALGYDHGKATIHDSGGNIESDSARLTAFLGHMVTNSVSVNVGAQIGYTSYDVKRNTIVGRNKGDTNGWHAGIFADAVGAIPLAEFASGASRLDLMPHVGFAASYYSIDSFAEKGSASALDTDSFEALSLEARIGATLNWTFQFGESTARASFDVSASHEFADDEIDIDTNMLGEKTKVSTRGISSTSFSAAPGFTFDFDGRTSVYVNYEFRVGTESEIAHSANIGFRKRF